MKWTTRVLNSIPGLKKKSDKPKPKAQPSPAALVAKPEHQATQPVAPPTEISQPATKPQKMLEDVCAFLARYLQCNEHQRFVLALWVLHTWCFSAAKATPYLAVQSSEKLSGKTLCLRLLSLLCANPALTSGYTAAAVVSRIAANPNQRPTFLLDQSAATVGSRSRSKNPKLQAILVSGFQPGIGYTERTGERSIFSPKAFAAMGSLPESLVDCSIPIVLKRLIDPNNSTLERFDLSQADEEAKPIVAALQHWSKKNLGALKSVRSLKRKDFPAGLGPRTQDMVEPLLHLADAIGGQCPERARKALVSAFNDVEEQQRAIRIQLLRDIRNIFQRYDWADGLPTALLVSELQSLPARPWDVDGRITDRTLPRMLRPFEIAPRMTRFKESGKTLRGYSQKEFVTVWHNLLDTPQPANANRVAQALSPVSSPKQAGPQQPSPATAASVNARVSSAANAGTTEAKIPNNDAGCYTVTDARIDPRIAGILADPSNYFRQYPESHKQGTRDIIVNHHHWPQPADDKGPADVIYTLDSGISIPYTIVNRDPWNPKGIPSYHNKRERWPVLLDDEEKTQVATARFFELHVAAMAQRKKENSPKEEVLVAP